MKEATVFCFVLFFVFCWSEAFCLCLLAVKDDMKEAPGFFAGLKLVFSYGPYVKAAITFLFLSMAIGVGNSVVNTVTAL